MRRSLVLAVTVSALIAAAPAGAAHRLVWLRENTGQVFATVSVDGDGEGEVGFFVGEVTGTHYHSFVLPSAQLARLRAQVAAAERLRRDAYVGGQPARPFVVDTLYVVQAGPRAIEADESDLPARLRPLVATLTGLIRRYSQLASSSPRRTAVPG